VPNPKFLEKYLAIKTRIKNFFATTTPVLGLYTETHWVFFCDWKASWGGGGAGWHRSGALYGETDG
jgi:hypothetical protein